VSSTYCATETCPGFSISAHPGLTPMRREESIPGSGNLSIIGSPVFESGFALPQLVLAPFIVLENHGETRLPLRGAHCFLGPPPSRLGVGFR